MGLVAKAAVGVGMLLGLMALFGCKDDIGNPKGPTVVFPDSNVSYTQHVQPLFYQSCNFAGCHDDSQPPSRLKLTTYYNLMYPETGHIVVERGRPDQSILVLRIEGLLGERMPSKGDTLNSNQINGIRRWILEGAKNN
jgi:hypothetical protein